MRIARLGGRVALAVAGLSAVGVVAAGPAGAAPSPVTGGTTTSTSNPSLAGTLLGKGILPIPADGTQTTGITGTGLDDLSLTFQFTITGGSVDPALFFQGDIQHSGGLGFVNLLKLRSVKVTDFDVRINTSPALTATLYAEVNGKKNKTVDLFTFDLSNLQLSFPTDPPNSVSLGNVGLTLTADGAALLDKALATDAFTAGLNFGTGSSVFQYSPVS